MTHVTIERAKAQRIADAFEDLKKNHGMVYVEELVDINQALAAPAQEPDIAKIEKDCLSYAGLICLGPIKDAYRFFLAQGKTVEDFDKCAWDAVTKAVKHAVELTAREVREPAWPYALDNQPAAQRAPVLSAGPITPEMAKWGETDKAELVAAIEKHAAQPAVPLTREQCLHLEVHPMMTIEQVVRVVEAAHGITSAPVQGSVSDDEITAWAERHDIQGTLTDLRCMFEDAASLTTPPAAQPAPTVEEPKHYRHQWGKDGERCVVCGDKDWMGTSCKPRTAAPPAQPASCPHGMVDTCCENYSNCNHSAAQPAPTVQEPVAYWIPKAEQFCIADPSGRPFAKAWEPLYTTPPAAPVPPVGDWIWSWLMDWCKSRGVSPSTQDSLFKMVKDARGKFESTSPAQPAPVQGSVSDDEITAWAERHDIQGTLTDLRCMFEDAASLTTPPAAQPAPTVPLTREQCLHLEVHPMMTIEQVVRVVEAAHGITKGQK